jgi:pimeloyl-ACP methyl ester carboxylesterase
METVNCLQIGESGASAAVILEGWGTNVSLYRALAERVAAMGYRVLLPDLPGFGESPEPARAWDAHDYAEFLDRFLTHHGVAEVTLIGHSHGGRVILKALGTHALSSTVTRVILIGSAGIVEKKSPKQVRKASRYRIFRRLLTPFPALLERYKRSHGSADYRAASPLMRDTLVKCVNEDLRSVMPEITVPTLLIWGENDRDTPVEHGRLMNSLIPGSGLVVVPNAGHYAHLDNSAYVERVIESFLAVK